MYDSSQPAPEAVVYISAASDDQNKDNQFAVVNGVADTPAAHTNTPDRPDATQLFRPGRVRLMGQRFNRSRESA